MSSKSKAKGNRLERLIVKTFTEHGYECKRAWGSNGAALGEADTVDNVVHINGMKLTIQAKSRKRIAEFMKPPEGADVAIIKEDRGPMLMVLPVALFLAVLTKTGNSQEPDPT